MPYTTVNLALEAPIARLTLDRPDKANAMSLPFWEEFPRALAEIDTHPEIRAVIVSGAGKHFSAGIDMGVLMQQAQAVNAEKCPARARERLHAFIRHAQHTFTALEECRIPVIAAIHGACIGAGMDLVTACDMRLCSAEARFCVKEIDLAVVPDVGTLHRLRHLVGYGTAARLCYTAENIDAARAERIGLVEDVFADAEALAAGATALAQTIAAKSPVTVRGIKHNLLFAREHSVADGMAYTAAWNASMLISADAGEAMAAHMGKRPAKFRD